MSSVSAGRGTGRGACPARRLASWSAAGRVLLSLLLCALVSWEIHFEGHCPQPCDEQEACSTGWRPVPGAGAGAPRRRGKQPSRMPAHQPTTECPALARQAVSGTQQQVCGVPEPDGARHSRHRRPRRQPGPAERAVHDGVRQRMEKAPGDRRVRGKQLQNAVRSSLFYSEHTLSS